MDRQVTCYISSKLIDTSVGIYIVIYISRRDHYVRRKSIHLGDTLTSDMQMQCVELKLQNRIMCQVPAAQLTLAQRAKDVIGSIGADPM